MSEKIQPRTLEEMQKTQMVWVPNKTMGIWKFKVDLREGVSQGPNEELNKALAALSQHLIYELSRIAYEFNVDVVSEYS